MILRGEPGDEEDERINIDISFLVHGFFSLFVFSFLRFCYWNVPALRIPSIYLPVQKNFAVKQEYGKERAYDNDFWAADQIEKSLYFFCLHLIVSHTLSGEHTNLLRTRPHMLTAELYATPLGREAYEASIIRWTICESNQQHDSGSSQQLVPSRYEMRSYEGSTLVCSAAYEAFVTSQGGWSWSL